jgi:hypothetical protein
MKETRERKKKRHLQLTYRSWKRYFNALPDAIERTFDDFPFVKKLLQ